MSFGDRGHTERKEGVGREWKEMGERGEGLETRGREWALEMGHTIKEKECSERKRRGS